MRRIIIDTNVYVAFKRNLEDVMAVLRKVDYIGMNTTPGLGFQVSVFSVQCSGFSVQCSVFSVQCSGFRFQVSDPPANAWVTARLQCPHTRQWRAGLAFLALDT